MPNPLQRNVWDTVSNPGLELSAGAVSSVLTGVTFSNSNGVSFGLTNGVVTASVSSATGGAGGAALQGSGVFTQNTGTVQFANSNGVTFGLTAGQMTATVKTDYQSAGAYLTTAALSQDSSNYAGTNGAITGGSITVNTAGVSVSLPAYLTTAQPPGAYLTTAALSQDSSNYAGTAGAMTGGSITVNTSGVSINLPAYLTTAALSSQTLAISNSQTVFSNGTVAFSEGGGAITIATSAGGQSLMFSVPQTSSLVAAGDIVISSSGSTITISDNAVGLHTALTANGAAWTVNSSGISLSIPAFLTTADLSQNSSKYAGTSTGMTGGSVTLNTSGIAINLPAYLTTAMQSNAATISNINVSAGTISRNLSAVTFTDSNGVSWGLNTNSVITATVKTDYQTSGAYLTTAALSGDTSKYAGINSGATNCSVTVNTSGVSVNVPAVVQSNQTVGLYVSSNTYLTSSGTQDARSLSFRGDKSITVGISSGEVLFSVGAYLTTAALSANTSNYAGINGAITGGSITVNTSGVSVNLPAYLTTAALSGDTSKYIQNWDLTGNTAGTTSSAQGVSLHLSGGNSITISGSSNSIVFSVGNYITTAALSGDTSKYAGINGAITGGSITVNTSGVSVNLPAYLTTAALSADSSKYAGTSTGMTGGSVTLNTSGIAINLPAYLTTADLSANSSAYIQRWDLLGANTAGTTTSASLSRLQLSAENGITLSGNSNTIRISIGAYITTAALSGDTSKYAGINSGATNCSVTVNTSGVSVNLPAYLTTAAQSSAMISYFENMPLLDAQSTTLSAGISAIQVLPFVLPAAMSIGFLRVPVSMSHISTQLSGTTASSSFLANISYTDIAMILTQNVGNSSLSLASLTSSSATWVFQTSYTASQGTRYTVTFNVTYPTLGTTSNYTTSYAQSSASIDISSLSMTLFTGPRWVDIPMGVSLSAGNYWLALGRSSNSATTGGIAGAITAASVGFSTIGVSQNNLSLGYPGAATNSSIQLQPGLGSWSTNSAIASTASLQLASISAQSSNPKIYFQMIRRA